MLITARGGNRNAKSAGEPVRVAILGAGGFARELHSLLEDLAAAGALVEVAAFVDLPGPPRTVHGVQVLSIEELPRELLLVSGMGGTGPARLRAIQDATSRGYSFASLVHPSVLMSNRVSLGAGTVICAGSILTTEIRIGQHVQVHIGCTISHDAVIEDSAILSPGCRISGNVTMEEGSFLGTGAVVIQGVRIGAGTIVGAGAVVTADLPPRVLAVGVPAKPIRQLEASQATTKRA